MVLHVKCLLICRLLDHKIAAVSIFELEHLLWRVDAQITVPSMMICRLLESGDSSWSPCEGDVVAWHWFGPSGFKFLLDQWHALLGQVVDLGLIQDLSVGALMIAIHCLCMDSLYWLQISRGLARILNEVLGLDLYFQWELCHLTLWEPRRYWSLNRGTLPGNRWHFCWQSWLVLPWDPLWWLSHIHVSINGDRWLSHKLCFPHL